MKRELISDLLHYLLRSMGSIELQICLGMQFIKYLQNDIERTNFYICTQSQTLIDPKSVATLVMAWETEIDEKLDQFIQRGSGWNKSNQYLQHLDKHDFSDVRGIVFLRDIEKFENKNNLSVNVYTLNFHAQNKPVIRSTFDDETEHDSDSNRCIVPLKVNKLENGDPTNKFCKNCLSAFRREHVLAKHKTYCYAKEPQLASFTKKPIKFDNYKKQLKCPIVIYADFEALVKPVQVDEDFDTGAIQEHEPCSFMWMAVDWNGEVIAQRRETCENAAEKMLWSLRETYPKLKQYIQDNIKPHPILTESEDWSLDSKCHMCEEHISFIDWASRHHDHDHLTGEYRGVAHRKCLDELSKLCPRSIKEKYLSLITDHSTLQELLMRKACLPYEYLDSFEKFQETSLSDPEHFYSSLTNKEIDPDTYQRLQEIWTVFECKNLGNFCDSYLQLDVIILCAVFENFRQTSMDNLNLDPVYFFSTPGLTWAAALRYTRQVLEPIPDMDTFLFIERGIRGGMTCVSERHAKANNPLCSDYDPAKSHSFIAYYDVNSLYGWALSQPLPYDISKVYEYGDLPREHKCLLDHFMQQEGALMEGTDFILEIDLYYHRRLHDAQKFFPLVPECMSIAKEHLGPTMTHEAEIINQAQSESWTVNVSL
ncbi:uncharacterized protein LOC141851591 [Brevipalpus obovatus]|uniref:uncharacterized protein LOC141851591 n=1 Tax=Brevipalpus obovatus TaxID=246614 RepID=UPI003D9ECD0A